MYIIGEEEVQAVRKVIESRQLFRYRGGEGGETDRFESAWAKLIGVKHAVALSSGTAALICGLVGMDIGPNDEVIVPAYTFMATALAVLAVGAQPVIVDIDESLTMDPIDFEAKITPKTAAVIPVHMNGLPCNMDAIMSIAKKYDLLVLEDACQADGGAYQGKMLGSIGDAGAFSFNHYKIITCGEGGAFVTDNQQIFEKGLIHHDGGATFRNYASKLETPVFAGWNFRINEILSAILNIQLNRLEGILTTLRSEKQVLMDALKNEPAFTLNPINDPQGDCATTLSLLFDTPEKTTQFLAALEELGVEDASTPIDSDLHVYSNWTPVLKRKGAHHPGRDAYQLAEHPVNYASDMCAKSLDILARTAFIPTRIDRSPAALEDLIDHIHKAARMIA
mgnify:CR=1 FL=1